MMDPPKRISRPSARDCTTRKVHGAGGRAAKVDAALREGKRVLMINRVPQTY
jgi:precorrin-6x reductase